MSDERAGPCIGGPYDGDVRRYGNDDMPVLAQGADTEGDLLGHYLFKADSWHWRPDTPPDDVARTR